MADEKPGDLESRFFTHCDLRARHELDGRIVKRSDKRKGLFLTFTMFMAPNTDTFKLHLMTPAL